MSNFKKSSLLLATAALLASGAGAVASVTNQYFRNSKLRIKTDADKARMAAAEAKRASKAAKLRGSQR